MLIDLLFWVRKRPKLAEHVLSFLGWHEGVHDMCPGWCPCDGSEIDDSFLDRNFFGRYAS